ncbi:LacI family transcriptional regulator [Frondihabitans sp. PhB188]|uniref:LacI family DNA-binding transcriptional regulator n=1 Tax=Frondihabitans sp. PhB188 TaxID=2485200 RepID=UPI000F91F4FF|nr:substrate-binding domain-containing protein [Frondihabitans sp. PhB188]ROQ39755.1 LacI family transcriptional regulator [Frondihabitans sp. PhB188]
MKPATIRDVAREAGVSVSVVSRVLNDGPVAFETRQRVVDAMEALSYRPRAAARDLNRSLASSVALLVPDLTNPFFARLADRIATEARAHDIQVVLMTTQEDPYLEADLLTSLLDRSVGGVIAAPTGENPEQWRKLADRGIELVFVSRTVDEVDGADSVSIRNAEAAATATRRLLDLGHRRIGMISGPGHTSAGRQRQDGHVDALRAAGVPVGAELLRHVPYRGTGGADAVSDLLGLDAPPTALIVANTAQVQSALLRLRQLRTRVPADLSVIAFDDNPWLELLDPPLSTVRQPLDQLAFHSVELVVGRLRGTAPSAPRVVDLPAEFIDRGSCRALVSAEAAL